MRNLNLNDIKKYLKYQGVDPNTKIITDARYVDNPTELLMSEYLDEIVFNINKFDIYYIIDRLSCKFTRNYKTYKDDVFSETFPITEIQLNRIDKNKFIILEYNIIKTDLRNFKINEICKK